MNACASIQGFMGIEKLEEPARITDGSSVNLRLLLTVAALAAGLMTTVVVLGVKGVQSWADMQANMRQVLINQGTQLQTINTMDAKTEGGIELNAANIRALQARMVEVEKFGTPLARDMEKRVFDLERKVLSK